MTETSGLVIGEKDLCFTIHLATFTKRLKTDEKAHYFYTRANFHA